MLERIERVASNLAALLMFALMLLTFVDVSGRNLINRPVNGASELTEILLAAVIFLMLPRVALRNQHIIIDLVDQITSRGVQVVLDIIAAVLGAVMFGIISWQMWLQAAKAAGFGDATPTLHVPLAPVFYVVSVLCGVTTAAFLVTIPKLLERPADERRPEDALV